jgi:membrane protein YqaA with SNARE-associated domain
MELTKNRLDTYFNRLKEQNPSRITINGMVFCTEKNPFGIQLPPFKPSTDGDWVCNLGGDSSQFRFVWPPDLAIIVTGATTQLDEVRMRPADDSNLQRAFKSYDDSDRTKDSIHCEISSQIGNYAVVGGAIGSVLVAAAAIIIAAILCAFALVVRVFIVALAAVLGSYLGALVGQLIGAGIGQLVDHLSDFDKLGKNIESNSNCLLAISGTWVTDIFHQHNEIHDIEAVTILCTPTDPTTPPILLASAVSIGRCPAGGNPIM